jgi:hypothetical protein
MPPAVQKGGSMRFRRHTLSSTLRKQTQSSVAAFVEPDDCNELVELDFPVAAAAYADKWDQLVKIDKHCTSLGLHDEYEAARNALSCFGSVCLSLLRVRDYPEMLKLETELSDITGPKVFNALKALQLAGDHKNADFSKVLAPISRAARAVLVARN